MAISQSEPGKLGAENDATNSTEIAVIETGEVLARLVGVFANDLTEADFL